MRVKHFLAYFPLIGKLRLFWERVTLSRLTAFYFIFSISHAIIQVGIQTEAFTFNVRTASFLRNIVQEGNATTKGFMVLHHDLRLCNPPPSSFNVDSCEVIWDGTPANDTKYTMGNIAPNVSTTSTVSPSSSVSVLLAPSPTVSSNSSTLPTVLTPFLAAFAPLKALASLKATATVATQTTVTATMLPSPTAHHKANHTNKLVKCEERRVVDSKAIKVSGQTEVQIDGLGFKDNVVLLDRSCLMALSWPAVTLENTKREDAGFIAFQLWVLGMSVVGLLNESIPHVLATLLTHMLATGWSGYKLSRSADFHASFTRLTTDGACKPIDLLPSYWKPRNEAEIASLVWNAIAFIVAAILSWRLTKSFGWRTFKRIGASVAIYRQYTAVLVLSISIQTSLFFMAAAVVLWIDQLYNGTIARLTDNRVTYKTTSIIVLSLLFPWFATGWFSVRRESKISMYIFLGLSSLYLVASGTMFTSVVFRWTFVEWYFFGTMASASVFLTAITLFWGGICLLGFGKGLPRYLNAEEPLPGDDFVVAMNTADLEKVNFPFQHTPTFSVVFGPRDELPSPGHTDFAPQMDPPFEPQPSVAHSRSPSSVSHHSNPRTLVRSGSTDSVNSDRSFDSSSIYSHEETRSTSSHPEEKIVRPNRWVIE